MSGDEARVYTGGACSRNVGYGGWAFAVILGDEVYASRSGAAERTTNNRMELRAAIEALSFVTADERLKGVGRIAVCTNSQYLHRGAAEWLSLWKERRWKNSDREPVKNRGMWEELDALIQAAPLKCVWIKERGGSEYNKMCDRLAKEALSSLARSLEEAKGTEEQGGGA